MFEIQLNDKKFEQFYAIILYRRLHFMPYRNCGKITVFIFNVSLILLEYYFLPQRISQICGVPFSSVLLNCVQKIHRKYCLNVTFFECEK